MFTGEISANQKLLVIDNENYYINSFDGSEFHLDKISNNTSGNATLSSYANEGSTQAFVDFTEDANGNLFVLGESYVGNEWSFQVFTRLQKLTSANTDDPDFNGGSEFTFNDALYSYYPKFVRVLGNGKIIIAGVRNNMTSYVMRLNADGTIDTNFGTNGIQLISGIPIFKDFEVLSDGKMLFAGQMFSNDFGASKPHIGRLNADGTLDTGFGTNGMTVYSFGLGQSLTQINKLIISATGEIFACGVGFVNVNNTNRPLGYVTKLSASGTIQASFGNESGFYNPSALFSQAENSFHTLEILSDGNIVVGGSRFTSSGDYESLLVFLNASGTLNSDYASEGIYSVQYNNITGYYKTMKSLKQQADGKLMYYLNAGELESNWNYVGRLRFVTSSGNPSGLNENALNQLSVYPNPGVGMIQLSSSKPTSATFTTANGSILATIEINGETTIDVSSYAQGVYFIRTAEGQTVKFVKH
jgi:uncharacterized delta-60 repeat protein